MRPLHLELEGFGAFREAATVDFADVDLVALVGATGSGKSTLIDAITFALYGSVARYDDNKLVEPVISQTSTRARVRLDFDLAGRTYTAVRVVQRTGHGATTREARLECDEVCLAADARSMTRAVAELLGLDTDQFNRTVVLPQGEFATFLHDTPANRQATLRELLGLGMYKWIGQEARQRAARERNQIDALQPDVDQAEAELTDERRATLAATLDRIGEVRQGFAADVGTIAELTTAIDRSGARLTVLGEQLGLLAEVRVPDGVDVLERRLTEATVGRDQAAGGLDGARRRRQETAAAATAGPDLAVCREQLNRRRTAADVEREHAELTVQLASARDEAEEASAAAGAVTARQGELDAAVERTHEREEEARAAADAGPHAAQISAWIQLHGRREASATARAEAEAVANAAKTEFEPLDATTTAAGAVEQAARERLGVVQERVGVAAHAHLLAVGAPCPLCLQEVHDLPAHHLDEELQRAQDDVAAASNDREAAERRRDEALDRVRAAAADVTAQAKTLALLDDDLAGVASLDVLRGQEVEARRLQEAVTVAAGETQRAVAAARAHRDDPANVAALDKASVVGERVAQLCALVENTAARLATAQASVADVRPETELTAAIAEAERLAEEQRRAAEALTAAEEAIAEAAAALEAAEEDCVAAGQQLTGARDRVAALGPPVRSATGLVAGWRELTDWAVHRAGELDAERAALETERVELGARRTRVDERARRHAASVLDTDVAGLDLAVLGERLVTAEANANAALTQFDVDRKRLAAARNRIAALRERAAVAERLGHLLRADGFERWLMGAALEGLVDAASVRLRELSGGQFSLVLDDGNIAVRDHANADEVRRARTLSGGETFLASLSLALALADATAELAPEGAPKIESIFLDEGFGTLDPQTLDTVATAIEELGATGRMVGIVTHIRELAERMPVRLEVAKTAATATVVKVTD